MARCARGAGATEGYCGNLGAQYYGLTVQHLSTEAAHPSFTCFAMRTEIDMLCSGEIDRDALGDTVFSDPAARTRLNAATHLPVAIELFRQLLAAWLAFTPVVVRSMWCSHTWSSPCERNGNPCRGPWRR